MITCIRRSVKRVAQEDAIYEKGEKRRIIARLGPGDLVSFRLYGLKSWTDGIPLKDLFWQATKRTALRKWQEENEKRKAAGRRLRRKPPILR